MAVNKIGIRLCNIIGRNLGRRISTTRSVLIGDGAIYKCTPCESKSDKTGSASTPKAPGPPGPPAEPPAVPSAPIRMDCPCAVRHGFIPEEWFTFFYNKTGVTGPYMFGAGLLNYLFSKEIWVCEHEFYNGISLAIICIVMVKKLGPMIAESIDKEINKIEEDWKNFRTMELKRVTDAIEAERKEQWRAEGCLMLMEIKKQNIHLQLEAAYRKALWEVYKNVKQKLDYQVACANIEQRINHKNMVLWVMKEVTQQMPQGDKEALEKYKADVSALAMRLS